MVISFCGHSRIGDSKSIKAELIRVLEPKIVQNSSVTFYLGGYGDFDSICFSTLKELQIKYSKISIIFVTPYIDEKYKKLKIANKIYDGTLFPPLENIPKRYAIAKRNEWIVEHSDLLIVYVNVTWGGAYNMLEYAKRKGTTFINIAQNIK